MTEMNTFMTGPTRFRVHVAADRWRAVDLADVYFVEAAGGRRAGSAALAPRARRHLLP
jgi:hypothetical protein